MAQDGWPEQWELPAQAPQCLPKQSLSPALEDGPVPPDPETGIAG